MAGQVKGLNLHHAQQHTTMQVHYNVYLPCVDSSHNKAAGMSKAIISPAIILAFGAEDVKATAIFLFRAQCLPAGLKCICQ